MIRITILSMLMAMIFGCDIYDRGHSSSMTENFQESRISVKPYKPSMRDTQARKQAESRARMEEIRRKMGQ